MRPIKPVASVASVTPRLSTICQQFFSVSLRDFVIYESIARLRQIAADCEELFNEFILLRVRDIFVLIREKSRKIDYWIRRRTVASVMHRGALGY